MRLKLATRFSVTIVGVLTLSILSSLVALYAAYRVTKRLEETARENMPTVRAEEAEITLLERSTLAASYLLDNGNPAWEEKLRQILPRFHDWITTVRDTTFVPEEEEALLRRLEETSADLDTRQEEAIALYKKGDVNQAKAILLTEVNGRLSKRAYDFCGQLAAVKIRYLQEILGRAERRVRVATWVVGVSGALTLVLGGILLWLFFFRVLLPLRGMVADARLFRGDRVDGDKASKEDELRIMGSHFRSLMSDVTDTRSRLDRSHHRLLATEKLASVGKLAASVAHEIRNPLTAMKMWLFSIQEAIRGNRDLERKIGIVSEEIARLENIIRNFLEFSRPPTIKPQRQDVGSVIEKTLELLGPRLKEGRIHIVSGSTEGLPPIMADPDQLKQVFINLLANAADSMTGGGEIRIVPTAERDADGRPMVVVRVSDTGPGMPEDVQRRIFEPFFTTKDTGTGLGLCIAAQIMAGHGGLLVLESSADKGTIFAVWTPLAQEDSHGQDPRS